MKTRRQMLEDCIVRGSLLAGVATMSQTQLLAFWQQGEAQAGKPTSTEVLGPFFRSIGCANAHDPGGINVVRLFICGNWIWLCSFLRN